LNGEGVRKKAELFDEEQSVDTVSNEDLRWMLLFSRKDFQGGLDGLKGSLDRLEKDHQVVSTRVQANALAVGRIQQAHDDCPLSGQEGRDGFMVKVTKICLEAAKAGVKEANGNKAVLGPLSRNEAFQIMGWVITILVIALVFLATNGQIHIPIP